MLEGSVEVPGDQTWVRIGAQSLLSVLRLDHPRHLDAIRCLRGQLQMDVRSPSTVFVWSTKVAHHIAPFNRVTDLPPLQIRPSKVAVQGLDTLLRPCPWMVHVCWKTNVVHGDDR